MIVRYSPLLACMTLLLGACSQESPIEAEGNAVANEAVEVGAIVQNSVVNVLDEARDAAIDVAAGDRKAVNVALAAPQPPGWGGTVDVFKEKEIALDPIADADSLRQPGEMGCAFVPDGRDEAVMVAKAEVNPAARAIAVISNDGVRERLASAVAGGFGALSQGTRLVGQGVAADIKLTSRVSLTPVGQQSSYPASLAVTAGKERKHVFAGRWICGLHK